MKRASKILSGAAIAVLIGSPLNTSGQTVVGTPPMIVTATGRTQVTPIGYRSIPASLQGERSSSLAAWVSPSRLGVRELQTAHAVGIYHSDEWSAALQIGALTMEQYTEFGTTIVGSVALSNTLTAGVTLDYTQARARGFSAEHLFTVNAQMVFVLDSLTAIGIAAANVGQAQRAGATAGSHSHYRIGASRTISSDFIFDMDIVLPLRLASGFAAALRWDAADFLSLRLAYTTSPPSAEASVRLAAVERLSVLATLHYHLSLGSSPTIGIAYQW